LPKITDIGTPCCGYMGKGSFYLDTVYIVEVSQCIIEQCYVTERHLMSHVGEYSRMWAPGL